MVWGVRACRGMGSQIGYVGVLDGGVMGRAKSNGSNEFFPTLGDRN